MTSTRQFIEDAIKGGWKETDLERCTISFLEENGCNGESCYVIDYSYTKPESEERVNKSKHYPASQILLDPLAWQAVGKTRGWDKKQNKRPMYLEHDGEYGEIDYWLYYWHCFIDHLSNGKSIEDALTLIST